MKGDLDRVRLHSEDLANLSRAEVGAVPQGDQVLGALVEPREHAGHGQPLQRLSLDVFAGRLVRRLDRRSRRTACQRIVDAATRDPEEPGQSMSSSLVVACAVPKGALEHLARHVFGVGTVPDPVGDVGVHAPDQRRRIRERVPVPHQPTLGAC